MSTDYIIRSESNKPTLCLYYFRNGIETLFPVSSVDHAIRLADAIADSDLLNENVDYNIINLAEYDPNTGNPGDDWSAIVVKASGMSGMSGRTRNSLNIQHFSSFNWSECLQGVGEVKRELITL